jgi:hypothetical protein
MAKCLNPFCEAAKPRFLPLNPGQQLKIAEPWAAKGERCSFCGAVYYKSVFGAREHRGFLDGFMMPRGWRPIAFGSAPHL